MSDLKPLVPSELNPALNPILVTDGAGLGRVRSFLERVSVYGLDIETNVTKRFFNRQVRTIQVGDRNEQYVIDLLPFADGDPHKLVHTQRYYGSKLCPGLRLVSDVLRPTLISDAHLKVGMNLEFEYTGIAWNFGIRICNLYGIDIADKLLEVGRIPLKTKGYFSMAGIVGRYFGLEISKEQQTSFDFETPLTEEQVIYAALDVRLPLAVRAPQSDRLTKANLWRILKVENDYIPANADMHLNGMPVNEEKWLKNYEDKKKEHAINVATLDEHFIPVVGRKGVFDATHIAEVDAEYERLAPVSEAELQVRAELDQVKRTSPRAAELRAQRDALLDARKERRAELKKQASEMRKSTKAADKFEGEAAINYDSPVQLYAALIKFRGINKTNLRGTDDESLERLAKDFPVVKAVQNFRGTSKFLKSCGPEWVSPRSDFGESEWRDDNGVAHKGFLDPDTRRIHGRIDQMGAETGRTTSSDPNLQNLPTITEVRSSFVPPTPAEIARLLGIKLPLEPYKLITCDMSGAELRIIADVSGEAVWVEAFNKGQDVHSVSTEILYPAEWPLEQELGCAYFAINPATGEMRRAKCKCECHKTRRDGCKSCNFLLCYGGGPRALAPRIGKTEDEAKALMNLHETKFPGIWAYLKKQGADAKMRLEARDMFGRRRLFLRPTFEVAKAFLLEDWAEKGITDRVPTGHDISRKMAAMYGSIQRRGMNHGIQSTNASIAKLAMGCGTDKNGKPFMWRLLPQFGAFLSNFVHDEFLVWVPASKAEACAAMIGDCIKRAAAEVMTRVVMEYEYHIADHWQK
jgi:DNA polymerase I-like protein with 3'-5' exonuclease and polymerase domains